MRDGDLYTSAGVTAGMDLALALVEEDLGRATALEVARWLVMFVKRPGGQSQFSAQLAAQTAEREPLRELQDWIAGNLDADLSVPALAERAHMSERNFARAFRKELGMTPAAYVESVRVEAARIALESADTPVEVVARDNGFGTVETMRRAFHRRLGVGPADYRARFKSTASRLRRGGTHADRHPAVRPLHRPRRDRALRGALAHSRRRPEVRRHRGRPLQDRQRHAHDPRRGRRSTTCPQPDILCVPGGWGTRDAMSDERLVGWIRDAHETSQWTTSVCTGSLLLGAAGVLDGLEATTHWLELETLREHRRDARPSAAWWSRAR